jgi:predicted O-methyltransferase YrrM
MDQRKLDMIKPDYETKLLQDRAEYEEFLAILKAEGVRSYLEIGLGWGGSLWRIGNSLPVGSRIVGVDRTPDIQAHNNLGECVSELIDRGYDASLILGDSTDQSTIETVREFAPFDCVFIDGDHSYEGVKSDWVNYGPMGRVVAFHDIGWNETWVSKVPGRVTAPMGVPKLWDEIKGEYRHREIKLYRKKNYYGIGVLWRE